MIDIQDIQQQVKSAGEAGSHLSVRGNNTRAFYGREISGVPLALHDYAGIIDYSPSELVISARAGTPLADIEATLAREGQLLAFEPPAFGTGATLGGTIACGLSGPCRPWRGAARDSVLGINCINGRGEYLRFGGQVMKNVAGYDLSRTLTGSLGTLAILLDIHLKVMPGSETELTLRQSCTEAEAIERCNAWSAKPLPLTAACHDGTRLVYRLSGTARGVETAASQLGGDRDSQAPIFWEELREQRLAFLAGDMPLWRLSVPAATPPLSLDGEQLVDWGGAQRWICGEVDISILRSMAEGVGGSVCAFRRHAADVAVFHPLPPAMLKLQRSIKSSFDPAGIFNPGRIYPGL